MAKDVDLFVAAMAGVKRLKGQREAKAPDVIPRPKAEGLLSPQEQSLPTFAMTSSSSSGPQTFDRDIDRALARGKRSPQAKLDLHGMTLVAAERAVAQFLAASAEQGLRVVLI
ncbi:MAG: Smr/MutS family protein, partial [Reyranellales bacterium]